MAHSAHQPPPRCAPLCASATSTLCASGSHTVTHSVPRDHQVLPISGALQFQALRMGCCSWSVPRDQNSLSAYVFPWMGRSVVLCSVCAAPPPPPQSVPNVGDGHGEVTRNAGLTPDQGLSLAVFDRRGLQRQRNRACTLRKTGAPVPPGPPRIIHQPSGIDSKHPEASRNHSKHLQQASNWRWIGGRLLIITK